MIKILIFCIAFFMFVLSPFAAFGQTNEAIESELVEHLENIRQFSSYSNDYDEKLLVRLERENEIFKQKLLKYTDRASTLDYAFDVLAEHLTIATSDDGKLRAYSWDTETGGTMHFFETVFQYRGADGNVYSKARDLEEGSPGSVVYDIFTADLKRGTIYLVCTNSVFSTSEAAQAVKVFRIYKGALDENVNLIKTASGLTSMLGFEYDFFSVVDREERPVKLIEFDKSSKSIKIPVVLVDKSSPLGRVTDRQIVYRFNGKYFVKSK